MSRFNRVKQLAAAALSSLAEAMACAFPFVVALLAVGAMALAVWAGISEHRRGQQFAAWCVAAGAMPYQLRNGDWVCMRPAQVIVVEPQR